MGFLWGGIIFLGLIFSLVLTVLLVVLKMFHRFYMKLWHVESTEMLWFLFRQEKMTVKRKEVLTYRFLSFSFSYFAIHIDAEIAQRRVPEIYCLGLHYLHK